jgi:two-component system, OmpR family, KDP operon response regulator KdpE
MAEMSEEKNKKRVLVVDDQPKVLKFIEIGLKIRGYIVYCATSGEQALQTIRQEKPDVMLLDMVMPGKDGFEVLRELRGFSKMPVIAFSASPGNQDPAMQAGANDFMHKPFDPDEMVKKIETFVDGRGGA